MFQGGTIIRCQKRQEERKKIGGPKSSRGLMRDIVGPVTGGKNFLTYVSGVPYYTRAVYTSIHCSVLLVHGIGTKFEYNICIS